MKIIARALSGQLPLLSAMPALVWQLLFLYVPLICMMMLSFVETSGDQYVFSLQYYHLLCAIPYVWVLVRSLVLAFTTALLCALFAYPVAYYLAFYVRRCKQILLFFLILPFWINFLIQIYSWFFVLEHTGVVNTVLLNLGIIAQPLAILNTTFAIYLVMMYCYVPFMIMPIYSALEGFDTRLFEASSDLGASPWKTFTHITLPLSASGIRTGFLLVFVPAFGEFVIPTLVGGGKEAYVGSLISYSVLVAHDPHMGAAFTVITGVVLVLTVIGIYWGFRKLFGIKGM